MRNLKKKKKRKLSLARVQFSVLGDDKSAALGMCIIIIVDKNSLIRHDTVISVRKQNCMKWNWSFRVENRSEIRKLRSWISIGKFKLNRMFKIAYYLLCYFVLFTRKFSVLVNDTVKY